MAKGIYKHVHYIGFYESDLSRLIARFPKITAVPRRIFLNANREFDLHSPLDKLFRLMSWGNSGAIIGNRFDAYNKQEVLVVENMVDKGKWEVQFSLPLASNIIHVSSIDEVYAQIISFIDGGSCDQILNTNKDRLAENHR